MGILKLSASILALLASVGPVVGDNNLADLVPKVPYDAKDLPTKEELARPPRYDEYQGLAQTIAKDSSRKALEIMSAEGQTLGLKEDTALAGDRKLPAQFRATILVSMAMGEPALKLLVERVSGREDVRLAFRGVPADMNVPEFAFHLSQLANGAGADASQIVIDPTAFERAAEAIAPVLLLEDSSQPDETGEPKIVARARGYTDPEWLMSEFEAGRSDYSSRDTVAVSEESLIARAEREAAGVMARLGNDNQARVDRYWSQLADDLARNELPPAAVSRTREIPFIVEANEAMVGPDGKVIAYPGERIALRDVAPFDRRIFVFNPSRPDEVAFVERSLQTKESGAVLDVLVVSQIPAPEAGQKKWDGLQALVDRLGHRVFVLPPAMRENFRIEATPTVIVPGPNGEVVAHEVADLGDAR